MDRTWEEFEQVRDNPIFKDKYDGGGNEIQIGNKVGSSYTYRFVGGVVVPIRGEVVDVSYQGVSVRLQDCFQTDPVIIPGGALKVNGKGEDNSRPYVWRMQNSSGIGPYHYLRDSLPEERMGPGKLSDVLSPAYNGQWDENFESFLRMSPLEDTSIGLKIFGWKKGAPINKHECYAYNVDTSGVLFGFLSEEQADAWFPEDRREALGQFGYSLIKVQAAKVLGKSGHQCVFIPA